LYGSQGHIFSDVQANPRFRDEPGEIDLVYKIQEGEPFRVGQINVHIAGEFPHTRRNVVLNKLSLRPGDLIDMRQIRDSERRLKFSQLFETEQTGGEPPRIVVRPPELSDAEVAANKKKGVRGQSPEAASSPINSSTTTPSGNASPMSFVPTYNIDVFVPQVSENFHEEIPNQALPYPYRLPANHAVNAVPDTIRRLPSIYSEQ
jgi:outer membrane protein insertion porin family